MLLVGLDAASRMKNFGYAIGELELGVVDISEAGLLETPEEPDALRTRVLPRLLSAQRALVAIDAPLGWPFAMAKALPGHRAGERLEAEKNALFRRETDRIIANETGKTPLEVGADRIARAAHAALQVLNRLRQLAKMPIPLTWAREFEGYATIEVYPAATLRVRGIKDSGYKKPGQKAARRAIARELSHEIPLLGDYVDARTDAFDACLCLVAAKDFLESETVQPRDPELARREGWIWVRGSIQ